MTKLLDPMQPIQLVLVDPGNNKHKKLLDMLNNLPREVKTVNKKVATTFPVQAAARTDDKSYFELIKNPVSSSRVIEKRDEHGVPLFIYSNERLLLVNENQVNGLKKKYGREVVEYNR